MIYFDAADAARVLERIHRALKPGGLLYVGHSENFTESRDLFRLRGKTIYERVRRMNEQRPPHVAAAAPPGPACASREKLKPRRAPARRRSSSTTRTSRTTRSRCCPASTSCTTRTADHDHARLVHRRLPVGPRRAHRRHEPLHAARGGGADSRPLRLVRDGAADQRADQARRIARTLEAKVFGGGAVISGMNTINVGERNTSS